MLSQPVSFDVIDMDAFRHAPLPTDSEFPSLEQRRVAHQIDDVLRQNGFFILRNFGLPTSALKDMFDTSKQLFSPPVEVKRKTLPLIQRLSGNTGYVPPDAEMLNSTRGVNVESKEAFNFRFSEDEQNPFKQDFSACPSQFEFHASSFWSLIMQKSLPVIAVALAIALDLPHNFFSDLLETGNGSTFRCLHYPPLAQHSSSTITIRAGEHTDFGIFTLLFTDSPGLQAQAVLGGELQHGDVGLQNAWNNVPVPVFGDAIVNVGAMMARITNDRWRAAAHRVIDNGAQHSRYSIACFMEPLQTKVLKVHSKFIGEEDINKYKQEITAGEYVQMRLTELNPK